MGVGCVSVYFLSKGVVFFVHGAGVFVLEVLNGVSKLVEEVDDALVNGSHGEGGCGGEHRVGDLVGHFVHVEKHLKGAGAEGAFLAAHDVGRDAAHGVEFAVACGFEEHCGRFFEGCFSDGSGVVVVDAVAEGGDHFDAVCHAVA